MDNTTLGASKKYTDTVVAGIQSGFDHADKKVNDDGSITMRIYFKNGTNVPLDFAAVKGDKGDAGTDGKGIKNVIIKPITVDGQVENHLICIMEDYSEKDAGKIITVKGDKGDRGEKGDTGISITSITKKSTTGLIDTYEITFSDSSTDTFDVTNGSNISKLSQLTNDSGYITKTVSDLANYYLKDDTYNKTELTNLLKDINAGLSAKVVDSLPTEDISTSTIYLVKEGTADVYNQWMYIGSEWASLGNTTIDLSSYYSKNDIDTKLLDYSTTSQINTILGDYAKTNDLSKVATSGSYNDLVDLPTMPVTDNNFTDEDKTKLNSLENYDDTEIKGLLADKIDKASISKELTSASTDDEVVSAKSAYNKLFDSMPIGTIISFGGDANKVPLNYMMCDGKAINRTDYSALFTVIGTTFGSGNGSTTFNLPDLRESGLVGVGTSSNTTITSHDIYALGQFKDDQMQGHKATYTYAVPSGAGGNWGTSGRSYTSVNTTESTSSPTTDGVNGTPRTGSTTHGKQTGVNFIIKVTDYAKLSVNAIDDTKNTDSNTWSASKISTEISKCNPSIGESYSSEETLTGGIWIDGKPIYRKAYCFENNISAGVNFDLGLKDIGYIYIKHFRFKKSDESMVFYPYNFSSTDWMGVSLLPNGKGNCYFHINFSGSTFNNCYVVIEYTKTTD